MSEAQKLRFQIKCAEMRAEQEALQRERELLAAKKARVCQQFRLHKKNAKISKIKELSEENRKFTQRLRFDQHQIWDWNRND